MKLTDVACLAHNLRRDENSGIVWQSYGRISADLCLELTSEALAPPCGKLPAHL